MAFNIGALIILGLLVDWFFKKFKLPGLIGLLFLGVAAGPYVLNLLNPDLMAISSDLRIIALIVILLRAGFELSKNTLKSIGITALILSVVPAVFEGVAVTFLGHFLLGLRYMESAILGSVLAAVSPAVVVFLMINFIERKMGAVKGIPTMLIAAASVNDVFVIVVYSVLIGIYTGHSVNIFWHIAGIPISIVIGITVGILAGLLIYNIFKKFNPRATKRMLVILGISILLVNVEHFVKDRIPFASLIAVMSVGYIILEKQEHMAHEISAKLGKLWIFAEIILFTLVGAQVNVRLILEAGIAGTILIFLGLVARGVGTYIALIRTKMSFREKLFVIVSYSPKATVQAAIGGSPLIAMKLAGMDTRPGEIILAVAVLSIILTAPTGAWAITYLGNRILKVAPENYSDAREAAIESE